MYAVICTGGKQYKVKPGDLIKVDLLKKSPGDEFDMEEILFVGNGRTAHGGEPILEAAKVKVLVTKQGVKSKKIVVFKKKRRQGYRKTRGHRQLFTELFVKSITSPDGQTVSSPQKDQQIQTEKVKKLMEVQMCSAREPAFSSKTNVEATAPSSEKPPGQEGNPKERQSE